ncbi:MAG: hypothetical protein P8170_09730 [Gemmatimonadota bacterium]|jgi:hypothetical protein
MMTTVRRITGFLVPSLLAASACVVEITGIGDHEWDHEATELVTRTEQVQGQTTLRVSGINGTIRVTEWGDAPWVSVRATKQVRSNSDEDAEAHLDDLEIRVWSTSAEIRVETVQPLHTHGREYTVDYEILVPEGLSLVGTNGNGDITVEDLQSNVDLKVGNGNVRAIGFVGTGRVESGNGNVDVAMDLPEGGEIVLVVGNGTAFLTVQPDVSAELNAQVGNGSIAVTGLDMVTHVSEPHLLRSTLGSGDGMIDVLVGNGVIQIGVG